MEYQTAFLDALRHARSRYTQKELAKRLGVDAKTVGRWERRETRPQPFVIPALRDLLQSSLDPRDTSDFTFIDLFAGIGGIRIAFESVGGRCVFTSEWNTFAQRTYKENFGLQHPIAGDITKVEASDIPDHDLLLAGFPCQPFSIAGVSKKNSLGRKHGFADKTQGTLFFDVARIIESKRPKAFLLENVKNLLNHDKGRTFQIILDTLRQELGYRVSYRVVDGSHFVPQHRERLLIAGFRDQTDFSWDLLRLPDTHPTMGSVLHPENDTELLKTPYTTGPNGRVDAKYTLSDKLWKYLQGYAEKHRAAGNGFGFGLVTKTSVSRTLSARYFKDGSEILVFRGKNKNPRRLTPRECARLMGFPDSFKIPVSDTQAYKQFGNSVVVPVVAEVARLMRPHIVTLIKQERDPAQLILV